MTDDGKDYKFVYDALGRLKTVKNQSNTVVAEYTYNGLNMRIGWHYDADADADVDANDPWYSFAHDDRWRIVATFRGSDTSPKELFAYHNAGANGRGGSSYIDSVILRNKDANTAWTSASDATLEERLYYVQNWRADVSAVLSDAGLVKEWIKYTSYGIPVRIDPGDYNRDGFVNAADFDDYSDDFDNARAEADVNFDGTVNGDDYDLFSEWWDAPSTAGRFTLSASSVGNRVGYAGYQYDPTFVGASRAIFHVRNRVYDAGLGRWTRRDPIGYKAGVNLYAYVNDEPINGQDPLGLDKAICTGGCDLGSSGPPKEPIKPAKPFVPPGKDCSQAVKDCKNGNSRVIEQLEKVESKCGDTPSINCEQCSGSEDAYHSSDRQNDPGSITICQNNIRDKMFICDAILHELQHAADKCDGFKSTLCEDFACLEVRAVNISGQCCPGRPYRMFPPPGAPNPFASYEDCVKWYAKDSVKNRKDKSGSPCNPGDSEVAKQINGCYSLIDSPCHERPNLGSGSTTYQ
ncbi:MAG: hypothetical protein IT434_07330 [Phycisphaerales bacterium]|nr:hypothetical protein [Phycisphaerales bacterium]